MNKCENCQAVLDSTLLNCPLCFSEQRVSKENGHQHQRLYPLYQEKGKKKDFSYFLMLFLSFVICSICIFVNVLTLDKTLWFVYVLVSISYLWLFIGHTLQSKRSVGSKIVLQTLGISLLLFVIDFNSGNHRWAVNIVIPIICLMGTLFLLVKMWIKKNQWTESIGYFLVMVFISFIPILLFLVGIATLIWTSASVALFSILTIVGMFIFAKRRFANECIRRFHL